MIYQEWQHNVASPLFTNVMPKTKVRPMIAIKYVANFYS
jgi:hypothetical protein